MRANITKLLRTYISRFEINLYDLDQYHSTSEEKIDVHSCVVTLRMETGCRGVTTIYFDYKIAIKKGTLLSLDEKRRVG